MTEQVFDNFNDAVLAAQKEAKNNGTAMYAVQWPLGHSTVEARKPSLRSAQMKVWCCDGFREPTLA